MQPASWCESGPVAEGLTLYVSPFTFYVSKMRVRYFIGKVLELAGLLVVGMALFAGLGFTPTGQPNMGQEFMLLGLGGAIFTVGWFLERGART